VIGAGLVGLVGGRWQPEVFNIANPPVADDRDPAGEAPQVVSDTAPAPRHARPTLARTGRVLLTGLLAWWGPLFSVALWRGWQDVLTQQALFFSKMAVVTFGGAYAVLAYMAQAAVEHYQWLSPGEMLDGLGLAESTPGPLIMVTQFVGFLGAFRHPSGLDPVTAGTLGALVTVWATFAPCFLWIFLGPHSSSTSAATGWWDRRSRPSLPRSWG
jgi:chromate transporter